MRFSASIIVVAILLSVPSVVDAGYCEECYTNETEFPNGEILTVSYCLLAEPDPGWSHCQTFSNLSAPCFLAGSCEGDDEGFWWVSIDSAGQSDNPKNDTQMTNPDKANRNNCGEPDAGEVSISTQITYSL